MIDHRYSKNDIEYRELDNFEDFKKCTLLQKKIFGFSDIDIVPPPLINLWARKLPPIGIVLGAFDKKKEIGKLVGYIFSTAIFGQEAIYLIQVGVLPEYQNQRVGFGLLSKLREISLDRKISRLYCLFDPLEGNLGNYYFNKFGYFGIRYEESAYELTGEKHHKNFIPIDKIMVQWELDSHRTCEKLKKISHEKGKSEEKSLAKYPIVSENKLEYSDRVLVKIPEDFIALKKKGFEEALKWRLGTRKIFKEYINNRGYWITDFFSEKKNDKRNNYYLLEKK